MTVSYDQRVSAYFRHSSVYSLLWLSPLHRYFVECDCPIAIVKRELIKVAEEVLILAFSDSSRSEALLVVWIAQHIPFII